MATLEISEPMFAETIENNELVLLDFWASGADPAKPTGPFTSAFPTTFPTLFWKD